MNANTARNRPSWLRIVGMQFTLILRSGRWIELMGGAILLLGLSMLGVSAVNVARRGVAGPRGMALMSEAQGPWIFLLFVLVSLWPAVLWSGESPQRRRSHWSLPVPRGQHDLARVAAGGIWVACVALLAVLVRLIVPSAEAAGVSTRGLVAAALGLLAFYCVASIPAVATAHPARWFFGVLAGYATLTVFMSSQWFGTPTSDASLQRELRFMDVVASPLDGRYGLMAATGLEGSSEYVAAGTVREVEPTQSKVADSSVALPLLVNETTILGIGSGGSTSMVASTLWILGAIVVLLGVSVARHER